MSAVWMMTHIAGQRHGGAGCWGTLTAPGTAERQATAVVGRGNGQAVPAEGEETERTRSGNRKEIMGEWGELSSCRSTSSVGGPGP